MSDLDQEIKKRLAEEDAALFDAFRKEDELLANLHSEDLSNDPMVLSFRKGARKFTLPFWISGFVVFCLAVFSGWRLFQAETTSGLLTWGVVLAISVIIILECSVWLSVEVARLWTGREIKRLELRLVEIEKLLRDQER